MAKKEDKSLLKESRDSLKLLVEDEFIERAKMLDDIKFCTLDQWPSDIRNARENDLENGPRPCLTVDKSNQYIVQIVNDARQGKPGINVRPVDDKADVETAKILKGLIRNIEDQSKADIAYANGVESAVKMGLGFWRVVSEYASPDAFDQELFIKPIPNTFSTYLGPHILPDGSDAKEGFIVETMPLSKFQREYPGKKSKPDEFDDLGSDLHYWHTGESVTVVERYWLKRVNTKLLFLSDGTTITRAKYDQLEEKPEIQDERDSFTEQLKWAKMTGVEVLEERDLPGIYIPIVEVIGRESWIEGRRILWGVVRPAKDALRMDNYIASTIVEKMALAPKTPYIAAEGQIAGREKEWKTANTVNRAVLQYKPIDVNGNALPAPQRQGAMPMEVAMVNYRQMIKEDVREALGMFKASVGDTESQQSGRAILALQHESDTGTYHFNANLGISIRQTGRILVDLIPHYYDTKRIVRTLGDDGTVETVQIDPSQPESHKKDGLKSIYNPGVGKFDVSITVGPSYNTKRMEAAATLTEVVKSNPQMMPFIGDLLFRSLDFPYSDQIAERMKKMLPPPLQDQQDPGAKLMQAMQKMQQMGMQMQEMSQENMKLKSGAQVGMAKVQVDAETKSAQLQAETQATQAELMLQKQKQEGEAELARAKAEAEFNLKKYVAEQEMVMAQMKCDHDRKMAEDKMSFDMHAKAKEQEGSVEYQAVARSDQKLDVIATSLQQMVSLQQQTLEAILAPKSVSIGGVKKDSQGNIVGANINTRPISRSVN